MYEAILGSTNYYQVTLNKIPLLALLIGVLLYSIANLATLDNDGGIISCQCGFCGGETLEELKEIIKDAVKLILEVQEEGRF
jgi:hypothetical protein